MKVTYDPEADALYIELRRAQARDSADIEEGVTADLDENGHIIGLEILDASDRLTPAELASVKYEVLKPVAARKRQPARKRLARPVKAR